MATITTEEFQRLKERARKAKEAYDRAERDAEIAKRDLERFRAELVEKHGKGMDSVEKLKAAEAKARAEAEAVSGEIEAALTSAGF